MVLEHVAQQAGLVVVAGPVLHPEGFGDGELDVVDVMAVPDRLEDQVREAEHHDVLHRVLAQIVVDPVDLVLFEIAVQLDIQFFGGGGVAAERLFQHHVPPRTAVLRFGELAGRVKLFDDGGIERRGHRQIDGAVGGKFAAFFQLVEPLSEGVVVFGPVVVESMVVDAPQEFVQLRIGAAGEFGADVVAEAVVAVGGAGAADDPGLLMEQPAPEQVVQRRIEFAPGEVAGSAEDDQSSGGRADFDAEIAAPVVAFQHN